VQLRDDDNRHFGDLVGEWNIDRTFPRNLLRPSLSLGEFTHAVLASEVLKKSTQQPLSFCAPERLHGQEASYASDMWGFMLIFFQLYTGGVLSYVNGAHSVSLLVGALGPFPEEWKGKCTLANINNWWYDQTGQFPYTNFGGPYPTLEAKLAWHRPDATSEERELVAKVLRKGLRYRPDERITAAQLLEDPLFNSLLAHYESVLYQREQLANFLFFHSVLTQELNSNV
jgi:serine/threonine protein kinase